MKKILLLLFALCSLGMSASVPTDDKVYASEIKFDGTKYYFEVLLEGKNYYTGYGFDILLPNGVTFATARGGVPNINNEDKTMYTDSEGDTEHTLSKSFPNESDHAHARVACFSAGNYDMSGTKGILFKAVVTIDDASVTWPIGAIKCYNVELNKVGQPFEAPNTETAVAVHTGETTLPLKVSTAAKWSTCILPFAASIPEGVKAYTCSHNDEEYIYLTSAESFAAYTPYILYAENGFDGNVSGTVDEAIPTAATTGVVMSGYLNGAIVPQTAKEGYVLQNHSGDVKFYAIANDDAFAIPAGKCWMNIPETQSNVLGFRTDDMAEGINNIILPASSLSFDLNGRQQKINKGVYIKNGKKTLSL